VEVVLFFFVLSPLLLTAGWGVFHAAGGPISQMRESSNLAEELTTARQAAEQLVERRAEARTLDPESKLHEALTALVNTVCSLPADPVDLIARVERVTELAIRRARENVDELEAAERYAKESAKSAAESMLTDAVERAGKLHSIVKETNARKDALLGICRDVLNDHDPDWAEAWYAAVEARKTIRAAQAALAQANEDLESDDEGVRAQAAEDRDRAQTDLTGAETALADAVAKQDALPGLPTDLTELLSTLEAVDRDSAALVDEADRLYKHIHALTNATISEMIEAAQQGRDAQDVAVSRRIAAANALASSADRLRELSTQLAESADDAEQRCTVRYYLVRDSGAPQAAEHAWNLKRAQVTAAKVVRRAHRTHNLCGGAMASFPAPGQALGASWSQGLSEIPFGQVISGRFPFLSLRGLFASLPWWMWIVQVAMYMLFVVAYWVPGDDESNRHEVRAMGLFLLVIALVCGIAYYQQIFTQFNAFVDMMSAGA